MEDYQKRMIGDIREIYRGRELSAWQRFRGKGGISDGHLLDWFFNYSNKYGILEYGEIIEELKEAYATHTKKTKK